MTADICNIIPRGWSHKTYDPDPEPHLLIQQDPPRRDRGTTPAERFDQWLVSGILEPCELPEVQAALKRFERMSDSAWQRYLQEINPIGLLKSLAMTEADTDWKNAYRRKARKVTA